MKEPKIYRLENWSTHIDNNPFNPPEASFIALVGDVYGHPLHTEGKRVTTSRVIEVSKKNGRQIHTASGSKYELGKRKPEFEQFLIDNNYDLDEENPIKFVTDRTPI